MKRKTIVGLIAVAAVIAVAMFAGCVEEEKASTSMHQQKYVASDIVGKNQSDHYPRIIISYNKDADKYAIAFGSRNKDGGWEQNCDSATRWYRRKSIDVLYPSLIDHVDLSTVTVSKPTISATPAPTLKTVVATPKPTPKPKFKKGDIVKEDIVLKGFPKATIISWIRGIEGENYRTSMIHISPYFNSYSISDETLRKIRTKDDESKKIMTIDELQKYQNHEDIDIHNPDYRAPLLPAELLVDGYYLRIEAIGEWSGSYGDLYSTKSVDGKYKKIIELESPESIISAVFQNQEEYGYLGVEIVKDGEILNSERTYASYGVVSVSSPI